jgi:hypothetical protein
VHAAALASSTPNTDVIAEPDGTFLELTDIPISPAQHAIAPNRVLRKPQIAALDLRERGTLLSLCYDLFVTHHRSVVLGPCIQGAVFELQLAEEPERFSYLDGYLTVFPDAGPSHFHLCLGEHTGLKHETPPALSVWRRCTRAYFARSLDRQGEPFSWSVQLFNGRAEQMITIFLPSPFFSRSHEKRLREPEYGHLALWNELRARYLGETTPQPLPSARRRAVHADL